MQWFTNGCGESVQTFIYISTNTIFISVITVIFKHECQYSAEQSNPKCFFMLPSRLLNNECLSMKNEGGLEFLL